jgi:hypothetical protein
MMGRGAAASGRCSRSSPTRDERAEPGGESGRPIIRASRLRRGTRARAFLWSPPASAAPSGWRRALAIALLILGLLVIIASRGGPQMYDGPVPPPAGARL